MYGPPRQTVRGFGGFEVGEVTVCATFLLTSLLIEELIDLSKPAFVSRIAILIVGLRREGSEFLVWRFPHGQGFGLVGFHERPR